MFLPFCYSVILLLFVVCYPHSSFAIILMGKRELVAVLVCLPGVSDCWMALPRDATGLSAVCDCGIS